MGLGNTSSGALREAIERHPVLAVGAVALGIRVLMLVIVTAFFQGQFAGDDATYSKLAASAVEGRLGWLPYDYELYRSTFAFSGPITWIYSLFGPVEILAQLYVAILGTLTAMTVTRLALEVLSPHLAIFAGGVVALFPSQVLWSSIILKDASVWVALAGIALAVAIAARSKGKGLILPAASIALLLLALGHLREHTLVVAVFALVIASVAGLKETRLIRVLGAAFLALTIPIVVGIGPGGWDLITNGPGLEERRLANAEGARSAFIAEHRELLEQQATLEREASENIAGANQARSRADQLLSRAEIAADKERSERLRLKAEAFLAEAERLEALAEAELQTLESLGVENVASSGLAPNLAHLPRGLMVMLFEPFPWTSGASLSFNLARIEALIWYPLLALAAIGLWIARRSLATLAYPIVVGFGVLLVYALTEGNVGTAFRHRGEFVWVVAFLAALALNRYSSDRETTSDT